jgi:hypothetical protein
VFQPAPPNSALGELLEVVADLIDALRQPLLLVALVLIVLLLVVRLALGSS